MTTLEKLDILLDSGVISLSTPKQTKDLRRWNTNPEHKAWSYKRKGISFNVMTYSIEDAINQFYALWTLKK